MRTILFLIIFQVLSFFQTGDVSALYHSGNINDDIHFSDLEIIYICNKKKAFPYKRPNPTKPKFIKGCLINRTDQAIYFRATLVFNNFFNKPTAKAKIRQKIPAFGKADFKSKIKLGIEAFSYHKIKWDVNSSKKWHPKGRKKKEKKSYYASIRELTNGIQITGSNSVTTEIIQLKKGACLFTAEIIGKNFTAYLKNKETRSSIKLFSHSGQYMRAEQINVEKEGPFTLKISTQGSWRILIDFPLPEKTDAAEINFIENDLYIIHLKNGKKILAEQLKIDTKRVSFISEGTQVSLARDKILKTELSEQ